MEERDQILIERYLAGELTEAERHDLERRRANDPILHQDILEHEEAVQALRQKQREELRQRFIRRDEILDKNNPEETIAGRLHYTWIWLAAALLAVLVMWRLFSAKDTQVIPAQTNSADTTQLDQPPTIRIDTINVKDSLADQEHSEKTKEPTRDMAANTKIGEELFAEYFEPYKDPMMDPTTRGEEKLSPLQQYQKAYWDGEYRKVVQLFSLLTPENQGNENLRFAYANALMETGKIKEAIPVLQSIIQNNTSKYKTESRFFLALAYLSNGDNKSAMRLLDQYLTDNKAVQMDKAAAVKKILTKLPEQ